MWHIYTLRFWSWKQGTSYPAYDDLRRSSRHNSSTSIQDAAHPGESSQLEEESLIAQFNVMNKELTLLFKGNTQLRGELVLIKSAFNSQTKKIASLKLS